MDDGLSDLTQLFSEGPAGLPMTGAPVGCPGLSVQIRADRSTIISGRKDDHEQAS